MITAPYGVRAGAKKIGPKNKEGRQKKQRIIPYVEKNKLFSMLVQPLNFLCEVVMSRTLPSGSITRCRMS